MPRNAAMEQPLVSKDPTRRASIGDLSAMRHSFSGVSSAHAALAEGQGRDVDGVGPSPRGVPPEEAAPGGVTPWIGQDGLAGRRKRLSVNLDVRSFDNAKALDRKGTMCGGVWDDIWRRSKHYESDWIDPFRSWSVVRLNVSATCFMFLAMFFTVVALAEVAREDTEGAIGVPEFILVTCAAGILQALFGPQPLIVVRPTGPVVLVGVQLWELSKRFYPANPDDPDPAVVTARFLELAAMVAVFVGVFTAFIAAFELSRFCTHFTRFTLEIFETFVSGVTFSLGLERVVSKFLREFSDEWRFGDALFSLALSACTFVLAALFSSARKRTLMNPWLRRGVSDYSLLLAVGGTIAVSFWPRDPEDARVERIPASEEFNLGFPVGPTADRSWFVGLAAFAAAEETGGEWWMPLLALVAALPITAYLYVEQNVTGILLQQPAAHLRKGSYFHGTMILAALVNGLAPLFGMPFVSHHLSPKLRPALTYTLASPAQQRRDSVNNLISPGADRSEAKQRRGSTAGQQEGKQTAVVGGHASGKSFAGARASFGGVASPKLASPRLKSSLAAAATPPTGSRQPPQATPAARIVVSENRATPLVVYSLLGCSLLFPEILNKIPNAATFGVLCFIGFRSVIQGNEFVERVLLLLVPVADFPTGRSYTRVPWRVMHTYTLVQLACFGTVVFVSLDPFDVGLGLAFPFLLLLNIPLRKHVLPKFFKPEALLWLDHDR